MTGTTARPDPQVVAWMRDFMRRYPQADRAMLNIGAQGALQDAGRSPVSAAVLAASYEAARRPLTPADIPAGQGAASLFTGPGPVRFETAPDNRELMYRREDGSIEILDWPPAGLSREAGAALWDLIATNVPAITEEGS